MNTKSTDTLQLLLDDIQELHSIACKIEESTSSQLKEIYTEMLYLRMYRFALRVIEWIKNEKVFVFKRMKMIRAALGIKQKELAQLLATTQGALSVLECGKRLHSLSPKKSLELLNLLIKNDKPL